MSGRLRAEYRHTVGLMSTEDDKDNGERQSISGEMLNDPRGQHGAE